MSRHVVVGTAGHVDHGKSTLVMALTGTDPDRWAEEKRRGITIDLGFALLPLGPDLDASIVDVPGHEDFVRNMVAGATGIDVALLVVAADEGVMPQTVEHLAILDFLGVRTGVVALTKADLAEPDWTALVRDDLRERLDAHPVDWRAIVPVSATTGAGLDDLRDRLRAAATNAGPRSAEGLFRMPVDRAFSVPGAGTVVTGTVWSGTVRTGDTVRLVPSGLEARVRSIEVHGAERDEALPGRRTAMALAGLAREAVRRGEMVVTDPAWRESHVIDVAVRLLPGARSLDERTRVRVHLGTAEVLARVTLGEGAVVRLRLEEPLVARWGDRGVLRAYSPVTTIGGFTVRDPHPPARPRRPVLATRLGGEDRLAVAVETAADDGLDVADVAVRLGIDPVAPLAPGLARLGDRIVATARLEEAATRVVGFLRRHHQDRPDLPGAAREALREAVGSLTDQAVAQLVGRRDVAEEGAFVRLADHQPRLSAGDDEAAQALMAELDAARFEGREVGEVDVRLAEFLVRSGAVRRLGRDRYYLAEHLEEMIGIAVELLGAGQGTPAAFRDRLGLSRKYLIPFLEWLDQEGYSLREGDVRRPGPRV